MPLSIASYARPTTNASGNAARMPAMMPAPGCGFSPRLRPVTATRIELSPAKFCCACEKIFEIAPGAVLVHFVFMQDALKQNLFRVATLLHPAHQAQCSGRKLVA